VKTRNREGWKRGRGGALGERFIKIIIVLSGTKIDLSLATDPGEMNKRNNRTHAGGTRPKGADNRRTKDGKEKKKKSVLYLEIFYTLASTQ